MNPLATISEGVGYGPLSTITQGFLSPLSGAPGIQISNYAVLPDSALLKVAATAAQYRAIPAPALLLVDGEPALLTVLGQSSDSAIKPAAALFALIPWSAE